MIAGTLTGFSQVAPDKYYVQFTDKNNSPYSIDDPSDYLSQRAIDRRIRQGIAIDEKDLPVNPAYLQGVTDAGAAVLNPTKWLNGVTIYTGDSTVVIAINALPYVANVLKSTPVVYNDGPENFKKPFFEHEYYNGTAPVIFKDGQGITSFDYGEGYNQIHMLKGDLMHDMGYRGQGMIIAVIDAGFNNADIHPAFDSLWNNNQILGTRDLVDGGEVAFDKSSHGTMVLSTIGSNYPGQLIGTAPKASFWMLRSEDVGSEYIIEEYNWVSAAEFADSAGVDVINSSLGYYVFNDPSQDHTYADMNGNTTPVTIGADIAASRGMAVCNSLGNEGSGFWYYLIAPSDGDSVFGIGAVDANGNYAGFSSHGPSSDGRIKPNVVAQGSGVYAADPSGWFTYTGGTSFSSPITAGMVACLWQANPEMNNMEILSAIEQSASQSEDPDDLLGYGIPDYVMANNILTVVESFTLVDLDIEIYPVPFKDRLYFNVISDDKEHRQGRAEVTDLTGKIVSEEELDLTKTSSVNLEYLPAGIYFLKIRIDDKYAVKKVVKL